MHSVIEDCTCKSNKWRKTSPMNTNKLADFIDKELQMRGVKPPMFILKEGKKPN